MYQDLVWWILYQGKRNVVCHCKVFTKKFHKLKIFNKKRSNLRPKELETFFLSWGERIPRKLLDMMIAKDYDNIHGLEANEENLTIIEKYKRLGIIKDFKTESYYKEKYLFD